MLNGNSARFSRATEAAWSWMIAICGIIADPHRPFFWKCMERIREGTRVVDREFFPIFLTLTQRLDLLLYRRGCLRGLEQGICLTSSILTFSD